MNLHFLSRHKMVILYGFSLALLLFLLKWLELKLIIFSHAFEIYIGAIAILFTLLGTWLTLKLVKPRTIFVEKQVPVMIREEFTPDEKAIHKFNLSKREIEVLDLMAKGYSNQEIANSLYVSVNTIKTHSSRLFEKLDVKRRTQAIEKAKKLNLIC